MCGRCWYQVAQGSFPGMSQGQSGKGDGTDGKKNKDRTTQRAWNDAENARAQDQANVASNTFEDIPGMWDADALLGPPSSNRGLKAVRAGEMIQTQIPRLPKTTEEALASFVPLFVPIRVLVDGVMVGK